MVIYEVAKRGNGVWVEQFNPICHFDGIIFIFYFPLSDHVSR